jgi:hypothetical protein
MAVVKQWARVARREIWNGFVVAFWAVVVGGALAWFTVLPSIGLLWAVGVLR